MNAEARKVVPFNANGRAAGRHAPAAPDDALLVPADLGMESAVIGGLIITNGADLPQISRFLRVRDFMGPLWAAAYELMLGMFERAEAIDYTTVVSLLAPFVKDGGISGLPRGFDVDAELIRAIERTTTSIYVVHYARRVREMATRREAMDAARQIARMAYDPSEETERTIRRARALIDELDQDVTVSQSGDVAEALASLADSRPRAWTTGIGLLDYWLGGGLITERVLAISGETGVGKTWLATRIMIAALEAGARCADFSLEMTIGQRAARYAACLFGRHANRLLSDSTKWTQADWTLFGQASDWLHGHDLHIYDQVTSARDIEAEVRRHAFEVVLIDYYGNLDDPEDAETEVQADRSNSRIIERMARRGHACVLVVAQRNEADRNLHFGQHLKRRCDASIKLTQPEDAAAGKAAVVELIMEKNRWEADAKSGGRGRFTMDKGSGRFDPVYGGKRAES